VSPYRPYAFNPATGRFYRALGNRVLTYQTGQIVAPVSAPAGVEWLTHGSARWRAAPELGSGVLRGGNPALANSRSVLSMFVPEAATVSFEWSCNIPNSSHQMALLLNTSFQASITGSTGWTARTVEIPSGGGMVSWSIRRGTTLNDSIDGRVRNITITPLEQGAAALAVNPAADADADGDGYPDLIEWATGSDPADPASRPHFTLERDGDRLRVEFDRRTDIPGLRVSLETSADLREWTAVDEAEPRIEEIREGIERIQLSLPLVKPGRFLRLRADHPSHP